MSGILQTSRTATLRITLPPPWQRVHMDRVFDQVVSARVAERLTVDLGGEAAGEVERTILAALAVGAQEQIVLSAIRARPDRQALDYMTLAFPPNRTDDEVQGGASANQTETGEQRGATARSTARTAPAGAEIMFPSRVQSVAFVPPNKRVALLTLLSTEPGVEPVLKRAAREIATSMSLTRGPDEPSALPAETAG
jgi:hypothetical protein